MIFDPYRKRFWAIATGACRSPATDPSSGKTVKCAFTLPLTQRRSVIGLAVSVSEDPAAGWYFYWWDAAVGWGTNNPTQPYVTRRKYLFGQIYRYLSTRSKLKLSFASEE